jgi:lactate dehydrogenase-like 2-hydroxyacid dehydrogenase
VVTPHAAWYSAEAEEAVYRRPVLSVRDVLEGREPEGAVNRP